MTQTIFDQKTRAALTERISQLSAEDNCQWGKMNAHQMLAHNVLWNQWILGKSGREYKPALIGFIFGKFALKRMLKGDSPIDRNVPSSDFLLVKDPETDIETLKKEWCKLVADYSSYSNPTFIHDFFGKMSPEQIGALVYKHTDHHLRQFGR